MDSVTQAALGAAVAGAIAGRQCSPKVLLAGAALGTLPDLDVLISYGDPVSDMVKHRGFSHSLFVLLPLSLLLSWLWQRWRPIPFSFMRLWLLVVACLITHPLLDACTTYGTQLFWPIPYPVSISSIFIIDPLYTLPLLLTVVAALLWRGRAAKLCMVGLGLSTIYLSWSLIAYQMIEQRVEQYTASTDLEGKPVFIAPTPLNTVLWRVVVKGDHTYWEGLVSLFDESNEIALIAKPKGTFPEGLQPSKHINMLDHFTSGFIKYEQRDNILVVSDLRLGMVDYLPFQFALATQSAQGDWQWTDPRQLESPNVQPKHLPALWLRLLGNQDIDANLCHISECPDITASVVNM